MHERGCVKRESMYFWGGGHPGGDPYAGTHARVRCWLFYLCFLTYIYYQNVWTALWISEAADAWDFIFRWAFVSADASSPEHALLASSYRYWEIAFDVAIRQVFIFNSIFTTAFMFYTFDIVGMRGFATAAYVWFLASFVILRTLADFHWGKFNWDWLILVVHAMFGAVLWQSASFGEWNVYLTLVLYGSIVVIMLILTNYYGYTPALILVALNWFTLLLVFSTAEISRKYSFGHYLS